MVRVVNEEEYALRRKQILDAALRLVYTKGYGQMTIQDILDDIGISKGAFYHYFDSKGAVLEALVDQMSAEIEPALESIVEDPRLSALEKLQRYLDTAGRWKSDRKSFMLELLRVWYADENALVRQKLFARSIERASPFMAKIVQQGIREGVFTTTYPEDVFQVNIYLTQNLGDAFAALLLSNESGPDVLERAERLLAAYGDALERVLGAPSGSIQLMDAGILKEWFDSPADRPPGTGEALAEEIGILESQKP
jgi:AcrR family transcriptional regulator